MITLKVRKLHVAGLQKMLVELSEPNRELLQLLLMLRGKIDVAQRRIIFMSSLKGVDVPQIMMHPLMLVEGLQVVYMKKQC